MADLPNNLQYGSSPNASAADRYRVARKAIADRYAQKAANVKPAGFQPTVPTKPYWGGDSPQPISGIPYAKANVNESQPQYIAPQTFKNAQTGQSTQSYVRPDYQTVPGEPGKFQSPSSMENLRLRNVPETSGGGQYVTDTQKPGEIIRSQRAVTPSQYAANPSKMEYPSETVGGLHKEILGGLPAARGTTGGGFQIDHIVPLWLGGADIPENKQLLDPYTHEKKTKIQAVALTLLSANKITNDQAKMMALRWKDKDESGITTFNNGFVDLKNAEEVAKRWGQQDAQVKPTKWGDVWNEMKNLKNFGQQTFGNSAPAAFVRELAKGTASTVTFGYIPYEMDDDYKDGYAKAAGMAGSVAGSVLGFVPAMKALGLGFGLMNKGLKVVGLLNKISTGLGAGSKAIEKIGLLKDPVLKTKLWWELTKTAERTKRLDMAWKSAGLFATYGQLSREGLLGQAVTGEETHWGERFIYDVALGSSMGGWSNASKAAKEALKVSALAGTLDSMLNYDDPDWTIQSSFGNGLTMGGLHYLFLKGGAAQSGFKLAKGGISHPLESGGGGGQQGAMMDVAETFRKKIRSGMLAASKYNPALKTEIQKESKASGIDAAVLEQEIDKAHAEMLARIAATKRNDQDINDIDLSQATKDYTINLIYSRNEYIASLPKDLQHQARAADMSTMMRYLQRNPPPEEQLSSALNNSKTRLDATVPRSPANLATDKNAAAALAQTGVVRIPLSGTQASPKVKSNVAAAEQLNKEGRLGGEGILIRDPAQGALINASLGGKYARPENHVIAVVPYYTNSAKTEIAGWLHVGNLPEKSFAEQYNQTKKFTEFNVEKANKDTIGDDMASRGESVSRFDLEWESAKTAEGRSAVVIQMRPDAAERSRAINESWNTQTQERTINDTIAKTDIEIMREARMPVEWMNGIVANFKNALETGDPVRASAIINEMFGKNTITPDAAKAILDKPVFTIKDAFDIVKGSAKWKDISFIVGDRMIPPKRAATAFKEYKNTNIKTAKIPEEIKVELPKNVKVATEEKKATQKPAVVKGGITEQAVTLVGEDLGGEAPAKRVSRAVTSKMRETPKSGKLVRPEALQKALRGAQQVVRESPLAKRTNATGVSREGAVERVSEKTRGELQFPNGANPEITYRRELKRVGISDENIESIIEKGKAVGRERDTMREKSQRAVDGKFLAEDMMDGITDHNLAIKAAATQATTKPTPPPTIEDPFAGIPRVKLSGSKNLPKRTREEDVDWLKNLVAEAKAEETGGAKKASPEDDFFANMPMFKGPENPRTIVPEVDGKRFTDKGEEIISLPNLTKATKEAKMGKFSNTEKELDAADLKRMRREDSVFGQERKQSLFEKAFSPKIKRDEGEYLESPSEASAINIMRAVGEKNIIVEPNNGAVYINPESKLTGQQIMEKSGLSNLEFFDGLDHMTSTVREVKSLGQSPGKVLGQAVFRGGTRKEGDSLLEPKINIEKTGRGTRVMVDGKISYPGSGMTDWMAQKAKSAEGSISEKKNMGYEEGLATAFVKGISKIIGKKVTAENLTRQFGVDGFFSKISSKSRAKTDTGESIDAGAKGSTGAVTQPRGLQKSRVEQERMRIGELPKEARGRLFAKRLKDEALSREQKDRGGQDLSSELSADDINMNEGPQIGKSTDVEQSGTFGLSMEDRAQSMKEEIPISELEYSLPGMALRTSGEKVNVTDGLKDGLMLVKQFADHYRSISKQKPGFVDFGELEKEIRSSYDPDFKKYLPLMKKIEMRRVTKAIMEKTSPEGTVMEGDSKNPAHINPPSPRINVVDMIKKYDGANPPASKKIIEMFLKKQGYKKQNTGRSYDNVWENKSYLNLIRANKEVKLANETKK